VEIAVRSTTWVSYRNFDLPMSRTQIADHLALTEETVSRTLTALRRAKIIQFKAAK